MEQPTLIITVTYNGVALNANVRDEAEHIAVTNFLRGLAREVSQLNFAARAYGQLVEDERVRAAEQERLMEDAQKV